ncbi:5-oxoprolinase subunit B family protein [Blastomonas sp.]|uniref:5-oxoprolinase subunit B family protein n=1 Tax=Blastomonas sp. TaxID=1909299 RepID=UPI00391D7CEE
MTLPIYCADDWLMIRSLGRDQVAGLAQAARDQGWEDVVPGLDSLSLSWNPAERSLEAARSAAEALLAVAPETVPDTTPPPITLHICYDSIWAHDAEIVAELLGIATDALPGWHAAQTWCVAMLGFQPGFGYLTCDAAIPEIPRLSDPRTQVAAGSVGLLGHICGLYPHAGPGGWPIIGRIAETLFDPYAPSPALLTPGQKVVFERVDHATLTRMAGESA